MSGMICVHVRATLYSGSAAAGLWNHPLPLTPPPPPPPASREADAAMQRRTPVGSEMRSNEQLSSRALGYVSRLWRTRIPSSCAVINSDALSGRISSVKPLWLCVSGPPPHPVITSFGVSPPAGRARRVRDQLLSPTRF